MNKRTLTTGVVACALGIVAVGVLLGGHHETSIAAAAKPDSTDTPAPTSATTQLPMPATLAVGDDKIQIALLVDTSSHMEAFLDEARAQLWKVVDEYARATRAGRLARLEIALYEYGNGALAAEAGYMRQVQPFTGDLDRVAESLFGLTTQAGEGYCGEVIQRASQELAWSDSPDDLRLVFIAGKGSFGLGPVDHRVAIAAARAQGIRVNTLHCGGDEPSWREGAQVAQGAYLMIDPALAHFAAPQDHELARLRLEQDALGCMLDPSQVAGMPFEALPPEMILLDAAGREAYAEERNAERVHIAERIDALDTERQAFVQAERARRGGEAEAALDAALVAVAHDQGAQAGYRFE